MTATAPTRVLGKYERLCWEREARDRALAYPAGLPKDPRRTRHPAGFWFDPEAGDRVVEFVERFCRHSKGEWAGTLIELEDWQRRVIRSAFGWMRADGTRRFRILYIEVPRKNAKSTTAAALGLYLTAGDQEPGAEVYSSAPLALTTPVPTPTGWTTMGDIREGDTVFDEHGQPATVTYVGPVQYDRSCYAITLTGGERLVADGVHRWSVYSTAVGSVAGTARADWVRRAVKASALVRTTDQLHKTLRTPWGTPNHAIALAEPLELPESELPIGPYTLGVWLGDGRQNRGCAVLHPDDAEILDHIRAEGYEISRHGLKAADGLLHFTVLGLRTELRRLGLLEQKHVPAVYLRASVDQRRALLQGLMDTDGTCSKTGECRFTNRSIALADAVYELASSLGFRASRRTVEVLGKPHYLIGFRAWQCNGAFRLRRKAVRQVMERPVRCKRRTIKTIEPIPSVPVRCIAVSSPSSLYLVGRGMVPTHNTKKDQAKIVHDSAVSMVKASPELKPYVKTFRNNIHCPRLQSKFEPLGADSNTLDGLNPHGNIIDELHAHRDRGVWDVLDTAMGARRQPMTIAITTAGIYEPESIGWLQHNHAVQVLEGTLDPQDDAFFAFIAAADEDDDWMDPETWRKANPNLGVSVKEDYLARQSEKAKAQPSFLNTFLRLHLNRWTQQKDRWIAIEHWNAADETLDRPATVARETGWGGLECYGGLDLSSKIDLTALVLVFPLPADVYGLLCRFWVPEERIMERSKKDRVPYDAWVRDGWITATPGNVVDQDFIEAEIAALGQRYQLRELAFDPWNATQASVHLTAVGVQVVEVRQGFRSLSEPSKELEKLVVAKRILHGGNPVLRWMVANVAKREDPNGNIAPDKSASADRIDGVVAAIMALSRAIVQTPSPPWFVGAIPRGG